MEFLFDFQLRFNADTPEVANMVTNRIQKQALSGVQGVLKVEATLSPYEAPKATKAPAPSPAAPSKPDAAPSGEKTS